jgi:hypothetical protein
VDCNPNPAIEAFERELTELHHAARRIAHPFAALDDEDLHAGGALVEGTAVEGVVEDQEDEEPADVQLTPVQSVGCTPPAAYPLGRPWRGLCPLRIQQMLPEKHGDEVERVDRPCSDGEEPASKCPA